MPSGSVALGDLDGDGDLDAYVATGKHYYSDDPPRFEGPNTVWLCEFDQIGVDDGSSADRTSAEAAVDELIATYWP